MRLHCAIVVGTLFVTHAAKAETGVDLGPPCTERASVSVPSKLPANIGGIPVTKTEKAVVSLLAPDGTELSRTVTLVGDLQVLEVPKLTVGAIYMVTWSADCGSGTVSFEATAEMPLPTTAGTLLAQPPYFGDSSPYACDEARRPIGRQYVPIQFTASAELAPFMGVTDVDVVVDGVRRSGDWPAAGQCKAVDRLVTLTASCPAATTFQRVAARVTVAGRPALSTPEIVVEVPCPSAVPDTECRRELPDAGPDYGTPSDCGDPFPPTTTSGCVIHRGGLGLFGWFALASVSMAWMVRRRPR